MDSQTLELFRCLQSGPYDEAGLEHIRGLLQPQRRLLRARNDLLTLIEIIELLQGWAEATSDPSVGTLAMLEASDIAERELRQPERAAQLRAQASANADERDAAQQANHFGSLGARRSEAGDFDGAIEAYERALDADANVEVIYALAELYTQRGRPGDGAQAADLYCTLGDVLGNPDGIVMLERALALQPKHGEARALFDSYVAAQYPSPGKGPPLAARPRQLAAAAAPQRQLAPAAARPRQLAPAAAPPPYAAPPQLLTPPVMGSSQPGWSSLPPIVVEDSLSSESKRGGMRWLVGGTALAFVTSAAVVFAMSTGRFEAGKAAVTHVLASVGVAPTPTPSVLPPSTPPPAAVGASADTPPSAAVGASTDTPPSTAVGASADAPAVTPPTAVPSAAADAPTTAAAAEAASAPEAKTIPEHPASDEEPPEASSKSAATTPEVHALLELATLRGGKLNDAQLSAAIDKATPKIERCYAQALKDKPRTKGRLTFGWTVRTNGKAASVKQLGGSIKDGELGRCTVQAITATRFPKPHKQSAQIKLPLEYRHAS
jgi:tetratricopeptide (TPR) repeat protein